MILEITRHSSTTPVRTHHCHIDSFISTNNMSITLCTHCIKRQTT